MNLPQVYLCSPSWTLLPPPSPYPPSGSSLFCWSAISDLWCYYCNFLFYIFSLRHAHFFKDICDYTLNRPQHSVHITCMPWKARNWGDSFYCTSLELNPRSLLGMAWLQEVSSKWTRWPSSARYWQLRWEEMNFSGTDFWAWLMHP